MQHNSKLLLNHHLHQNKHGLEFRSFHMGSFANNLPYSKSIEVNRTILYHNFHRRKKTNPGPLTNQIDVKWLMMSHKHCNIVNLSQFTDHFLQSLWFSDKYWQSFTGSYLSLWILVQNLQRQFIYLFIHSLSCGIESGGSFYVKQNFFFLNIKYFQRKMKNLSWQQGL